MTPLAHTTSTAALLEKVVGRIIEEQTQRMHKSASQQSPNSVSNVEESSPEQKVTQKLQHKGDDYAKATMTSFGLQQTRDLTGQGPNTGPLPDKASSDQPEDRSSENDTKSNPLYDVFHTPEKPTQEVSDPGTQGDPVSEKLQLKKDAAALLTRMDDVNRQGQEIIDYLMRLTVDQKHAGAPAVTPPSYSQEELLTEAAKLATGDAMTQVKTALLHAVDDAIYAAEATALQVKQAEKTAKQDAPIKLPPLSPPAKQASDDKELPPPTEVGGEQAMAAMSDPAPAEMGAPISEEEAQALMMQSLQENGIDPGAVDGGAGALDTPDIDISPEEIAMFEQAMQQAGVGPEEVAQAIAELEAEQGAGITPEQGMIADEEAAKTGHYKFASFINRPAAKTAQQEQRAAMIRGAVRDFIYGPSTRNFN